MKRDIQWTNSDFAVAMSNGVGAAAHPRFIRREKDKVLFNGFWRDGDKQNVCLWLDKATWHDAKTGEGGGCKEFAKTAFNMTLPEFMERYGRAQIHIAPKKFANPKASVLGKSVHKVWTELNKKDSYRSDRAGEWLNTERGFDCPRDHIGSGFANLYEGDEHLFEKQHQSLIQHRISLGPQLTAPIRGVHSDEVKNLFFRAMTEVSKEEKSRLLTGCGGWSEPDGSPRAFGFPHLIHEFQNLVVCEGMADYFAAECLLDCDRNYLPIGASNASALVSWSTWLLTSGYQGKVIFLYQLDKDPFGKVSSKGIGQTKTTEALRLLLNNKINAALFNWPLFIKFTNANTYRPGDIADICKADGCRAMAENFLNALNETK
jgi:hypothetical protein